MCSFDPRLVPQIPMLSYPSRSSQSIALRTSITACLVASIVRAMFDDKGRSIEQAGPSTPVEVSGLDVVPTAGEAFVVVDDITRAREVATQMTKPAENVPAAADLLENFARLRRVG